MKIVTIVGARPQFIKAAGVSRELRTHHREVLVHTGQHYDYAMSGVFFEGLNLPAPEVNLEVGSGTHGTQTSAMLQGIEKVLIEERPDRVLIYGDTNSTLAGAIAAAKLHIPIVHIESGMRSFNRRMPEEINRVIADHLSNLLLCPSRTAVKNLAAEGISKNVYLVGDVMHDVLQWALGRAKPLAAETISRFNLNPNGYLLATVHRSENTDNPEQLTGIVETLNNLDEPVLFPVHPRARKHLDRINYRPAANVRMVEPLSYFEMVIMAGDARMILTDSGGLQKEAYWMEVPCVTLREETEWVETVDTGWNRLTGSDPEKIVNAVRNFQRPESHPVLYGNGHAGRQCVELIEQN